MKKVNLKTKCIILLLLVFALNYTFAATCGDVNNSGGVDIVDALMVAQFSVGLNPSGFVPTVADVNSDGSTTIVDALMVAQFYVGLISQLSCTTSITPTPTSTATLQSLSIACGSSAAVGSFLADQYYSGGSTYNNTNTVDVSLITSNPPPAALFNNERYGALSYTIPGFTAGGTYAVTMYFAETYLTSSGGRVFNVSINGTTVLSNFDIYAVAGAQNKAIAQAFTTTANSSGQVVIQLTAVTENPKINGISIQSGTAPTPGPTRTQTATPTATRTATSSTSAKSHVFLLLGQSNMAGYPTAQQSDKVEDSRILVLGYDACSATGRQTDQWDIACPPLHECYQGAIGPGDWFAKTLIQYLPQADTIRLVPCAISGEKIETFMKVGGSKYSWIINRAKLAQQAGGVIEGIIFNQGESNNGDSSWPGKVNTLITDIRNDLGIGNVPFVAGELLYSGSCAGHNTLINQLPGIVSNCSVASASGLVVDPADTQWKLHFDHNSQVTFGQRYAAKMKTALGW